MPIYEYQCESCGYQLEKLQKMSEAPLRDCPTCEKPALVKKISAAGFRLKGGGWYETDFKSANRKNLAGDKNDSKPAEKSVDKPAASKPASDSSAA